MKKFILTTAVTLAVLAAVVDPAAVSGQTRRAVRQAQRQSVRQDTRRGALRPSDISHFGVQTDERGDTVAIDIFLNRVYCFSKPIDMSRHRKLVRDFRAVYPLALVARQTMSGFEEQLLALPTRREQREFSRATEKSLVEQYTPTMKRMTVSQGRILVRLIDRETDQTSYQIVREFRGGFVAGFWQGIARIFGHNLKDEYDPVERDRVIEQCILLYNVGLLPEY